MTANDNGPRNTRLPLTNVEFAVSESPTGEMAAAAVKGFSLNPFNAGAGPFPALVSDAEQ
jgi:hypothetical protein